MPTERRLAAIMFTDIVGSTAMMGKSERGGREQRIQHIAVVQPLVQEYGGEWIEEKGDEALLTFSSALGAVNCALAIQSELLADEKLQVRIGIHAADVVFEDGKVYGDGVNVAARVREQSVPGSIYVTGEVWQTVRNQPNVEATSLGERDLKNVDRPVSLYEIRGTAEEPALDIEVELILVRQLGQHLDMPMLFLDRNSKYRFWNEAAAQILGRRFDEDVDGITDSAFQEEVASPRDEKGVPLEPDERPMQIAIATGKPAHGRVHLRRPEGTASPHEVTAFPLFGQSGRIHGVLGIFWPADD